MGNVPEKQISSAQSFLRSLLPQFMNSNQQQKLQKHINIMKEKVEQSRIEQIQAISELQHTKNKYSNLERRLAGEVDEKNRLKETIKNIEENVENQRRTLRKKTERICFLQREATQKDQIVESQKNKIKKLQKNEGILHASHEDLRRKLQQISNKCQQQQESRQRDQQRIRQLLRERQLKDQQIERIQQILEQMRVENSQKDSQLEGERSLTQYLQSMGRNTDIRAEQTNKENQRLLQECLALNLKCRQMKQDEQTTIAFYDGQISRQNQYRRNLQNSIEQLIKEKIVLKENSLFQHSILTQQSKEKKYLMRQIERVMHYPIKSTKLLFAHSPDGILEEDFAFQTDKNYALIMKKGNCLTAAFSGTSFYYEIATNTSLLSNLTRTITFQLEDNRKAAHFQYRKPFLSFGNDEIRIKDSKMNVFSGLGRQNSLFNRSGYSPEDLFDNQSTLLQSYEIYQLFFEQGSQ